MSTHLERLALAVLVLAYGLSVLKTQAFAQPDASVTCNRCVQGYVWREAFPGDHVCVTAETRTQTAYDNSHAEARRQPGGGAYGPDTCRQGFVWRDARKGDHVCVTAETRAQAAADYAHAAERCADGQGERTPAPDRTVTPKRAATQKESFWTTLPGILTALGGLIVALTGLVKVLKRSSK